MEVLARVELGMNSEDFYKCTWYDWGVWLEKIRNDRRKRTEDHELLIEMFRSSLCRYYNWNRGKNPELSPEDFWVLSYDKDKPTDTQASEQDNKQLEETIKRLESRAKKNKRG